MTIKQQGGIFGRNPSFNDVDANSLNVDGTITSDGLTVDGTTSLEDVTVSLNDTTSADSMPALDPNGSELLIKNTNNSADYTGIRLTTRTSAAGSWVMANEFAESYKGDLVFHARDGASSSADKITFTNAGSIKINTSGQGIDFSATSGTGTSELFDDYEEGTWTPTGNGITFSAATGTYTKIGNSVRVTAEVTFPTTASISYADIGGLPFTSAAENTPTAVWSNHASGIYALVLSSGTSVRLYSNAGAAFDNVNLSTELVKISVIYGV